MILLPAPTGELEADAYVYHFLGWSREALTEDSTQRPDLLVPGSRLQLSAGTTELWAVSGYFAAEDPAEAGQFRLVSEEPEDWAGDYVLTYQSTRALRSSPQVTGPAILSPAAVATDVSAGYFVDREWLNEVLDKLVYSFVPCDDGSWLLKMKTSENYLAVPSSNAMLSTLTAPDARESRWRIQWTEGTAMITNRRFTSRILQFSTGSSGFCTLTSLRCPLTLYRLVPGEHRYTTQPHSGHTEPDPGPAPDPEPDPEPGFDDVDDPKAYYYGPVYWAVTHGITGGTGLILHSDQGWHYQHKKYQRMPEKKGIRQSMSRKGNCLDNAVIDNFFGLLKSELLYLQNYDSMEHFKAELIDYLDYYNNRRIKLKLKGLTPAQHRCQTLQVA